MTKQEQKVLLQLLHEMIMKAVPKAETVSKYGGTLYTLKPEEKEGQFCGIFAYKKHVQLSFSRGTSLDDPDELLTGTGKFRRHVSFTSPDEISTRPLTRLIKQSAKL